MSRRSSALKTLQTSPSGVHIIGKSSDKARTKKISNGSHTKISSFMVREDIDAKTFENNKTTFMSVEVNTEINGEMLNNVENDREAVLRMLTDVEPTSAFWKHLAEERKQALEDALLENLRFCQEIAKLKEENRYLQRLADEGREFAEILKLALHENEDGTPNEGETQKSDDSAKE